MFVGKLSCQYIRGVNCFAIPAVIKSVNLQSQRTAKSQLGVRALVELLTHRCRSSIYGLDMIWELSLNLALGMKLIFSIIMTLGLGLPTDTIAFRGPMYSNFLTLRRIHLFIHDYCINFRPIILHNIQRAI